MERLKEFMRGVKDGEIRGDWVQSKVDDSIIIELSVGPFEYGHIHLRVLIDDERIDATEGMYYRHLYKIDSTYQDVHQEVQQVIEDENEAEVSNAHVWESARQEKVENYPALPESFNPNTTVFFEDHIQLRDDVTIEEAIMTNRQD